MLADGLLLPYYARLEHWVLALTLRTRFQRQGLPIIIVDSKKREMIGNFKNGGAKWGRTPQLLVLADAGGSNSCASWAWKIALQTQLCNPFGIAVTIAHYPTRASKWNPFEHRLFSEISQNWAAEPLDSYEKMLKFTRTADTRTGLVVTAYLDRNEYPTHLKPDPQLISSLRLAPGKVLPRWNYTIRPNL